MVPIFLTICLVLLLVVLLFIFAWYWYARSIRRRYSHIAQSCTIPGSNHPPFVDYLIYSFDGRNTTAPYGDFELSFPLGFPLLMVSDPTIIKELMRGKGIKDYDKGDMTLAGVEGIAGRENLFSSDGEVWQHQRLVIDPSFRPNWMRQLVPLVVKRIELFVDKWDKKKMIKDVVTKLNELTLDVICQVAFGVNTTNVNVIDCYKAILNGLLYKMIGLGNLMGTDKKMKEAATNIENVAKEGNRPNSNNFVCEIYFFGLPVVLDNYRKNSTDSSSNTTVSLISLLLAANKSDTTATANSLTDRQVIDNIKIFLFAGHESTASTLIWVLYLLAIYPEFLQSIRYELHHVLVKPPIPNSFEMKDLESIGEKIGQMTYEDMRSLVFLNAYIKETLRLYPPAWAINRSPKSDLILGGYRIPSRTIIMINTLRLHRREDLGWHRPFEFMPERWLENETPQENELNPQSKASLCYLPFGGGPRSCVGQPLAEMELISAIAIIITRYNPYIANRSKDCSIDYFCGSTIRPKNAKNLRLILLPTYKK